MNWFDDIILNNGIMKCIGDDGKEIIIEVGKEVVEFIKENKVVLSRLGIDGFKQALQMIKADKEADAKIMLMKTMDNWELIDVMDQTAEAIMAAAKFKEEFNQFLSKLFIQIGKSVAIKLLLSLVYYERRKGAYK